RPAAAAGISLEREHGRPGRNDDHYRPDQGAEERPQDPERSDDQGAEEQHGEDDARQIALRLLRHARSLRGRGPRDIGPWSHCWRRVDLLQCKGAMRIVIGNLPDDVSEEGIREALKGFAPVEKVKLVKESGTPSALIEMEMSRASAEALAKRISGRLYQGRPLRAWVPVMDW